MPHLERGEKRMIGRIIASERRARLLSQRELADQSGIKRGTISAVEQGLATTTPVLMALLGALELTMTIRSREGRSWQINFARPAPTPGPGIGNAASSSSIRPSKPAQLAGAAALPADHPPMGYRPAGQGQVR